ncbi:hypothetical protein, partial [Nocardia brasiliensis]|uniref:hypothetical protein n=1 Tax=Nocardia brasiliensis TaxID=37326 RepID=UPI003D78DAC1
MLDGRPAQLQPNINLEQPQRYTMQTMSTRRSRLPATLGALLIAATTTGCIGGGGPPPQQTT